MAIALNKGGETVNTLYVSPMLQQKQGYQAPEKLPVCDYYHSRQTLVLAAVFVARLA